MNTEALIAKIHELGLSQFESDILSASRPCLSIHTSPATSPIGATETKIGGDPDLPENFAWPSSPNGTPMLFLARLAEADLKRIYPHLSGRHLLFFADWEFDTGGRIVNLPTDIPVASRTAPQRPPDTTQRLVECVAEISEAVSLPSAHDEFECWRYPEELRNFGTRTVEAWPGSSLTMSVSPLRELVDQHFGTSTLALARPHRCFGYPLYTQGHPAQSAEQRFTSHWVHTGGSREDFVQKAARWHAVLSLDTDANAKLYFSDTGNCGFLVTAKDLASGCFDEAEFYQDEC